MLGSGARSLLPGALGAGMPGSSTAAGAGPETGRVGPVSTSGGALANCGGSASSPAPAQSSAPVVLDFVHTANPRAGQPALLTACLEQDGAVDRSLDAGRVTVAVSGGGAQPASSFATGPSATVGSCTPHAGSCSVSWTPASAGWWMLSMTWKAGQSGGEAAQQVHVF